MNIIYLIIIGFFSGLVARAVMPGDQSMGLIRTTLLGIGGAFVGGAALLVYKTHDLASITHARPEGFVGAFLGALCLLILSRFLSGKAA